MAENKKQITRLGGTKSYYTVVRSYGEKDSTISGYDKKSCAMLPLYIQRIAEVRYDSDIWIRHVNYRYAALEFILSGKVRYSSDRGNFEAGPGDIFFIGHQSNIRYTRIPEWGEIHKVYVAMGGSLLGIFLKELGLEEEHLFQSEDMDLCLREIGEICQLLRQKKDAAAECTASGMMCAMLYRLAGNIWKQKNPPMAQYHHLETLSAKLQTHIDQPLDNKELAAALNVGMTTSHKKFVRKFGLPPHRYMRKLQLERSKEMLLTTNLSVSVIAEECGFSNVQYFITLFKKWSGLPPGKFRTFHALQETSK